MPLAQNLETRTNSVEFEDCIIEHPDLDPKQRLVPLNKEVCLSIVLNCKLLDMSQIEHLELKQSAYKKNLETFGNDMLNLKDLSIDHAAD